MPLTNPPPPVVGTPPSYFSAPLLGSTNPTVETYGVLPTTTYANSTAPLYAGAGSGGGGGAVDSVSAGAGLVVAPPTGDVVVSMPNVGVAGVVNNVANITTDAQGRVSATTSYGYVPVAPAALAAYAPLAGATFTGAVKGPTPVANADLTTKQYVDSQIVAGGGVQSVSAADGSITVAGTAANPTLAVAAQAGVVPGAYTNANVTVNSKGVITAVSSGSVPPTLAAGQNIALDTTTTPGTTIIKQDITSAVNMNSNEINNCGNISAPVGGTIDITGSEVNITQTTSVLGAPEPPLTGITALMNFNAPGGIVMSGGVGVGIAGGTTVQITSLGNISIGSGNALGADTEIEHVSFKDNVIKKYSTIVPGPNPDLVFEDVDTINTVAFSSGGAITAPGAVSAASVAATGAVNGASVTATSGNIQALTGSIFATGAGPGQGEIEAENKITAPFADLNAVFVSQIQLGDNSGVNELTLIGNEPGTHIITAIEEGGTGTPGGVVDTRINPISADLTGSTLNIKAKNGAGAVTTMASVNLSGLTPDPLFSQFLSISAPAGTPYNLAAGQMNAAIDFEVSTTGSLTVNLPNGVPAGSAVFIKLNSETSAPGTNIFLTPPGVAAGSPPSVNIKPAGGCFCVAMNVAGGDTQYAISESFGYASALAAYLPLAGGTMTGTLAVQDTTNIEAKNITTALLTPLPSVGYISALGPMQVEGGNFLVANPAGSEIGLAASANPPVGEVATITYNYTNDDLIHLNKVLEAPGAVLDGNDVVPLITFKDAQVFNVSKDGSDANDGSVLAPFLTIQAAVTAGLATNAAAIVQIGPGVFTEDILIQSVAGITLQGCTQNDRGVEGTVVKGTVTINCTGANNLNNNMVVLTGLAITPGRIRDLSSAQHTLIISDCRIEGEGDFDGSAVEVDMTATDGRTLINNCIITQESSTSPTANTALITINVGFLDMYNVQASVRSIGHVVAVKGTSLVSRMANCQLTSGSASATPSAILHINSSSASPHNIALTSFAYDVATSKTAAAILATRPSAGSVTALVVQCLFALAGTLATGNVIQYGAGTALVLLVADNRSLNTAAAPYASQIQSGSTVLPLSLVGETRVNTINNLNGAITLAGAGTVAVSQVGNTITFTGSGGSSGITQVVGGSGISIANGTGPTATITNTGLLTASAGSGISIAGSGAGNLDIANTGILGITAADSSVSVSSGQNPTVGLPNQTLTPGNYTWGNITVDQKGIITAVSENSVPFTSISAGDGISVTGSPGSATIANTGVLSVGVNNTLVNTGTASEPVLGVNSTGTITTQVLDTTKVQASGTGADYSSFGVYPRVSGAYVPPSEPSQLVPLQYVNSVSGVQTVSAGDASITVGGTAADPSVAVAASGVVAASYTNASITVLADGRVSAASSGTAPVTAVSGTSAQIASTGGTTPVLSLVNTAVTPGTYTNATVAVDSTGRLTSASSGAAPVTAVSGTAGQVTSTGGTTPVLSLANSGVVANTYAYPASITFDALGRATAAVAGTNPATQFLALAGGTMTGPINMGAQAITNAGTITTAGVVASALSLPNAGAGTGTAGITALQTDTNAAPTNNLFITQTSGALSVFKPIANPVILYSAGASANLYTYLVPQFYGERHVYTGSSLTPTLNYNTNTTYTVGGNSIALNPFYVELTNGSASVLTVKVRLPGALAVFPPVSTLPTTIAPTGTWTDQTILPVGLVGTTTPTIASGATKRLFWNGTNWYLI